MATKPTFIPRAKEADLRARAAERPCILLTGARQTGKTTLLRSCFPNHAYLTFDSILLAASASESPEAFLDRIQEPVLLDEIQYVPALFRALKSRIDAQRDSMGRFLLTGSQVFELMRGVSESLAGRIGVLHLETLSAREIADSGIYSRSDLTLLPLRGGYPELWRNPGIQIGPWFEDYLRTYIERDLKELVKVRDLVAFRRFLSATAGRAGQLVNFTDLGRSCGASPNTARAWIAALQVSGILYLLHPWFSNPGTRLVKSPKLYFADTGLLCALLAIDDPEALDHSPHAGAVWENFVFTELVKTGGWAPGRSLFFYRDHAGNEVDFLGIVGDRRILVEAKHSQRIRPERLGFDAIGSRATPIPTTAIASAISTRRFVAAPTGEPQALPMRDFDLYDPRFGFSPPAR